MDVNPTYSKLVLCRQGSGCMKSTENTGKTGLYQDAQVSQNCVQLLKLQSPTVVLVILQKHQQQLFAFMLVVVLQACYLRVITCMV